MIDAIADACRFEQDAARSGAQEPPFTTQATLRHTFLVFALFNLHRFAYRRRKGPTRHLRRISFEVASVEHQASRWELGNPSWSGTGVDQQQDPLRSVPLAVGTGEEAVLSPPRRRNG